jgi:dCMP deaminase
MKMEIKMSEELEKIEIGKIKKKDVPAELPNPICACLQDRYYKPTSWDDCMMEIAFIVSKMSKDPRSQIGAILVSPDRKHQCIGYNGFPSCVPDLKRWWDNRDVDSADFNKYELVDHAEDNVIDQCPIRPLTGWSLYVTHRPCLRCAKRIVKNEIKYVYYRHDKTSQGGMDLGIEKVDFLFKMCGVKLQQM